MKILKLIVILLICFPLTVQAAILKFKWSANDPKEQVKEYIVYQDGVKVASVNSPLLTATVNNVTSGNHSFYVTAVNEWGEGPPSNVVSTPPLASAPSDLQLIVTIEIEVRQ